MKYDIVQSRSGDYMGPLMCCCPIHQHDQCSIPHIKRTELRGQIDYQLDVVRYNGPKKPEMQIQFKKKIINILQSL